MSNNYFEGYYFKHQKDGKTVAFIPGKASDSAFIQVIDNDISYNFEFSDISMSNKINVGNCMFSTEGVHIDLPGIKDEIEYTNIIPLRYDIMGPFKYFPMECRHGIISMWHKLKGKINIDGKTILFIHTYLCFSAITLEITLTCVYNNTILFYYYRGCIEMDKPNYESFSQCLSRLLTERDLSSAQLSHMLHHKSKTTLFRVFQNQAGGDSLTRVYNELLKCNELHLIENECQELSASLAISQNGVHTYRTQLAMWELLRQSPHIATTAHIDIPSKQMISIELSTFFAQISHAQHIKIIMINCCWHSVVYELTRLLDAPKAAISIQHYMTINSDTARTIHAIHSILPIMSYRDYMGYSLYETSDSDNTDTMNINAIIVYAETKDTIEECQILMHDESYGTAFIASGIYNHWSSYISRYSNVYLPVKNVYPSVASASDYVRFTEEYYRLELNRKYVQA